VADDMNVPTQPAQSSDIVTRLREVAAAAPRLVPEAAEAAAEIERLRAQVEHAHAILASEDALWLVVGSSHEQSWRQLLTPAIQSYWDKYGNYFKEADRG